MANDIKQSFTIDVSQAVSALGQLDKAYGQHNGTLDALAKTIRGFNTGKIESQIDKLGKTINKSMVDSAKGVERLTVSWGLLSRIVTTQFIVSEFRRLRATMGEAVDSAIDFQTQIAEIQTIAGGTLGTMAQVSSEVRRVSDAFNLPLSDTAKGLYEAISSQIGKGAENVEFLSSAAAFAKGSVTSLENSVTLLSGTLNAFGKDASQTDEVAAKLFRTIDLGNVTAEQLTTSFNRSSAQAKQLGVSFEEQAAAFTTFTNQGVKHNEAATRLTGILTALTKPTESMTRALREMGFSSGETAVATLGLGGLLVELDKKAGGSAESLAKLFPNVRGLGGALLVTSDGGLKFNAALESIKNTGAELNQQKALQILATDAQRVTAEANKLKNALTAEIGDRVLRIGASFIDLGVSAKNLTAVLGAFFPVIGTGTLLLGGYAAAALKGATANKAFVSSFKGLSAGLLLGAGAAAGGSFVGDQLLKTVSRPQREFDAAARQAIESLKRSEAEKLRVQTEEGEKRVDAALANIRELNKAYLTDVANAENAGKLIEKNSERITGGILTSGSRAVESFKRAAEDARQAVDASINRVSGLKSGKSDRAFAQSVSGADEAVKVFSLSKRAAELAREAAGALSTGDKGGLDTFRRAAAAAAEADAIARGTKDRALQARAAKSLDEVTDRQIDAEKLLQSFEAKRGRNADSFSKIQSGILDNTREQIEIIRKNSSVFGEDGKLLPPEKLAKQKKTIEEALKNIKGFTPEQLLLADRAGFGKAAREIELELAKQKLQLQFDTVNAINKLQLDLTRSFDQFRVKLNFDLSSLEQTLGRSLGSPDEVAAGLEEARKKVVELSKGFSDLSVSESEMTRLRTSILGITEATDDTGRSLLRLAGFNTTSVGTIEQKVAATAQAFKNVAGSSQITDQNLQDLLGKVEELRKLGLLGNVAKNVGIATDVNEFSRALTLLQELKGVQDAAAKNPASVPGAKDQLQNLKTFVDHSAEIRKNFEAAARAAAAVANPPTAKAQGRFFGGRMSYFAAGGRGLDTIPAMLSPGEFVVNAKSTRKFFSQIQAINAGVQPTFRNDGGSTVIGDTVNNVTVNAARNPQATADAVIAKINRAQRRGTARIR